MKKITRRHALTDEDIGDARAKSMKKVNGPNGLEVTLGKSGTNYFRYRRLRAKGATKRLGNSKKISLADAQKLAEKNRKADETKKRSDQEKCLKRCRMPHDNTSSERDCDAAMDNLKGAVRIANTQATPPVLRAAICMVMVLPSLAEELLALEWGSVLNEPRAVLIHNNSRNARKSLTKEVKAVYLPDSLYRAISSLRSSNGTSPYVFDNKDGGHWSISDVFAEIRQHAPEVGYLSTTSLRSSFKRWILGLDVLDPKFVTNLMRGFLFAGQAPEDFPEISAVILDLWSRKLGLKDLNGQIPPPSDRFASNTRDAGSPAMSRSRQKTGVMPG